MGGEIQFAKIMCRTFFTGVGKLIECQAIDDVTVIGVVTFTICDVLQDNAVV